MRTCIHAISLIFAIYGCGSGKDGPGDGDATDEPDLPGDGLDGSDGPDALDGTDVPDDGADLDVEEEFTPVCNAGTRWSPGTVAFRDVTTDWGLYGVVGVRLSIGDVDGDGWADLFVRNGGGEDDFGEGGTRRKFVMRNLGGTGFEDVTQASGLLAGRLHSGADYGRPGEVWASGDVDNDGDLDVFVGATRLESGEESSEMMLNNGDGTFTLGPEDSDARFLSIPSKPAGVTFVDFDRDGFLDLWITQNDDGTSPSQDRLLEGDGTGGFRDVTLYRGLYTSGWVSVDSLNAAESHSWAWSSHACDLNNDGIPELLASSYGRAPNHLWRGTPGGEDVLYENESVASGYAFDHRDDWTEDLNARCYCEDNPSAEDCDLAPTPADYSICASLFAGFGGSYRWDHDTGREPFRLGGNSGSTVCADVNNDGWFDLVTHEIVHWDVGPPSDPAEILVNLQDPLVRFDRPGNDVTGLERTDEGDGWDHGYMTGAVFDFDNDGWPDVYIGASDYPDNFGLLFHQDSAMEFVLMDTEDYFLHYRAHGVAVADLDRDGDLDIAVGHSRARCDYSGWECSDTSQIRVFENLVGDTGSNWIQLRLEGAPGTNRATIGARVEVTAGGVTQMQQVEGGHGHYGIQHDLVLHFGLGEACEAEVTVHWPDAAGSTQTFTVESSARWHVLQGEDPQVVF